MPRDVINIQLAGGVDTKTDPKAVDVGQLLSSQNVVYDTLRALKKRNGNLILPSTKQGGGIIPNGLEALATFNSQLLATGGDSSLYGVDVVNNACHQFATMQPMSVETTTIQSLGSSDLVLSAMATAVVASPSASLPTPQGIQVTAWELATGGVNYQVADLYSGSLIVPPTSFGSPFYCSPRALTVGNTVVVFAVNGSNGNIVYNSFPAANPTSIATGNTGATVDTSGGSPFINSIYDVTYDPNDNYLWFITKRFGSTAPQVTAINATTFATVIAQTNCPGITDALLSPPSMTIFWSSPNLYVFTIGQTGANTQRVNWTVLNNVASSVASGVSGTTASVGTNGAGPIATAFGPWNGNFGCQIFVQTADATTPLKIVQWAFNISGASSSLYNAGAAVATQLGLHLVSKFVQTTGGIAMSVGIVAWESPQQATYFVIDHTFRIHGKFSAGTAGSAPDSVRNRLTDLNLNPAAPLVYNVALSVQAQVSSVAGVIVTRNGVQTCTLNFGTSPPMLGAQLGGNLHMTGGQLWNYDGQNVTEHGFPIYPEWLTANGSQFDAPAFNIIQTQPASTVAGLSVTQVTCPPASLITNGSFLQLKGDRNFGFFLVFGINGATPAVPFTIGANNVQAVIPLLSTDTSATVAQKCYSALIQNAIVSLGTISLNLAQSSFTSTLTIAGGARQLDDPSRNSQEFTIWQYDPGTAGAPQIVNLACPAAKYLSAGQYFIVQGNTLLAGKPTSMAVWFQIAGSGTAPSLGLNGGTLQVTLTGTETGAQVATAINTAINGAIGVQAIFTAAGAGLFGTNTTSLNDKVNGIAAIGGYNVTAGGNLQRTPGTPTAGVYGYAFTYRWTDLAGQVHQSAPSPAVAVSIGPETFAANSVACGSVIMSIPTLRVTNKTGVTIDIWRTVANGGLFYRLTSSSNPIANSTTTDSVSYHDTASDDSIIGNDILYTIGSLPNVGPTGSCKAICTFQNRLILAGLDDGNLVSPSQQFQPGQGIMFNGGLDFRLDPFGGDITAVIPIDGNLLIFKKSQLWVINGNGPDPLGNGEFSPPQLITGNAGCLGPSQCAATQLGIVFVSEKGAYLCDRSLTVTYIGAPAESLINDPPVTSVLSVENQNQVRFFTQSGYTVIWDYYIDPEDPATFAGRWGVFTVQNGIASVNWNGVAVFIDAALGVALMENPGSYLDGATAFTYQWELSWIDETARRQGFQRVFKALLQGLFNAGQTLTIDIQYDNDTTYTDTVTWTPAIQGDGNSYGAQIYGVGIYGGQTTAVQLITSGRINPPRHRCAQIKFRVTETTPANMPLSCTALTLEIETIEGAWRIGSQNVAG